MLEVSLASMLVKTGRTRGIQMASRRLPTNSCHLLSTGVGHGPFRRSVGSHQQVEQEEPYTLAPIYRFVGSEPFPQFDVTVPRSKSSSNMSDRQRIQPTNCASANASTGQP